MKMDNQRRIAIPTFFFEKSAIKKSDVCYVEFISEEEFILTTNTENRKIIAKVKLDERGRFVVPKPLREYFEGKDIIAYLQNDNVGFWVREMS